MKNLTAALIACATLLIASESIAESGDAANGAAKWADHCARCHNMRDPTEFEARLWRPIVTHMRIRGGLPGAQARDILAFLQGAAADANRSGTLVAVSSGADAVLTTSDSSGRSVYQATCVACHGSDGKGVVPGAPDFTAEGNPLMTKSAQELLKNVSDGFQSKGSPMAMPAKGGNPALSEQDMRRVVEYLLSEYRR